MKDSYTLKEAKRCGNVFTINQLCQRVDLDTYEVVEESDWEYIRDKAEYSVAYDKGWDWTRHGIYQSCAECDGSGEVWAGDPGDFIDCPVCDGDGLVQVPYDDIHEMPEYEDAYTQYAEEHYEGWKSAVEEVFEKVFEPLGLEVIPVKISDRKYGIWDAYRLQPAEGETWWSVTEALVEVINGVGYFWFDNARDLMESIPTNSPKQAFFDHIHWATWRPRIYGTRTVNMIYESAMDHYLRAW